MSISAVDSRIAAAQSVRISDEELTVELTDGRTISVPLMWYPRLFHGTTAERGNWRLIGKGQGIHWPDLDEDISVENLLFGKPSGESQKSLGAWLEKRRSSGQRAKVTTKGKVRR